MSTSTKQQVTKKKIYITKKINVYLLNALLEQGYKIIIR